MDFTTNQPIYLQIADYVCEQILLQNWKLGDKIISIRDLAVNLEVNPNTVQRAYDFLQQRNIIINRRGVGYFTEVDAMERILAFRREQFIANELPVFLKTMYLLKIDPGEIKAAYETFVTNNYQKQTK
jgi:DNA-binding transcriptional regulator YhcF (GntR family)